MTEFAAAKKAMLEENTESASIAFSSAFAKAVSENMTVFVPTHKAESGTAIEMNQQYGEMYAVIFSDREYAVIRPGGQLAEVRLGDVISIVYSNPRLAGIAVDPQGAPIYIKRRQIDALTELKDPRLEKRDWGDGVPPYDRRDLMVIEELMDLAMDVVSDYAVKRCGYNIIESHSSPVFIPNLILEKDGRLYYAVVEAAIAPAVPQLSDEKLKAMKKYAETMDAKCLYAAVGIGSSDAERFMQRIALCGDSFIPNFTGFKEV